MSRDLTEASRFNHGMTPDSLVNDDWNRVIGRLGGAEALASGACTAKAFAWGRKVPDAVTLLRLVLAYCLGQWSLRSTAAWAAAAGFADISNVGLLYRLRRCGDWLALLVGHVLANHAPKLGHSLPRRRPGAGCPHHRRQLGAESRSGSQAAQRNLAAPQRL